MTHRYGFARTAIILSFQLVACGDDVGDQVENPLPNFYDAASDRRAVDGPVDAADVSADRIADRRADGPPTASAQLAAQSSECNVCAYFNCSNILTACDSITGNAAAGPAAGTPKAELCAETLACVLSTGCRDFGTCYCGQPAPKPHGVCLDALQRSMETTVVSEALVSTADYSKGGGWAMMLVKCLSTYCDSCLETSTDVTLNGNDSGSVGTGSGSTSGQVLARCEAFVEDVDADSDQASPVGPTPPEPDADAEVPDANPDEGPDASDEEAPSSTDGSPDGVDGGRIDAADDHSADAGAERTGTAPSDDDVAESTMSPDGGDSGVDR